MTPAQQQQFELAQFLHKQRQPLSYEQWLAERGGGNPYAQAPSQQPDYGSMMSKAVESKGEDYLNEALFSAGNTGAAASGTGGTVFSGGATVAGQAVGTAANGGTMMSTGVVVPASQGAPVASSAMGAEAATTGAFDLAGVGSAGNVILPAAGAIGAYDLYKNRLKTGNKKRGALQGAASGAAMGSYFGPWGAVAGGVIGAGVGLTAHESTRDATKRRTQQLLSSSDDPTYQAFVRGMREQYNSAPPDPSKPFAGKYGSWDEYKKAGLEAADLTGVMGNLELGADYAKLTPEQKIAFTQSQIDKNRYNSKKGDVLSTDLNAARTDLAEMIKSGFKISTAPVKGVATLPAQLGIPAGQPITKGPLMISGAQVTPPIMIPRSKTKSPGIGMDGKPISYRNR